MVIGFVTARLVCGTPHTSLGPSFAIVSLLLIALLPGLLALLALLRVGHD
jgi:hypothetical protein